MDFLLLSFIIFIMYNTVRNTDAANQTLSIKVTSNLQCVLIFFVMFHHFNQGMRGTPGTMLSTGLGIAGRLAVGLFFFLSGYGLMKQYIQKREAYINNFIRKRFISVFFSFFLASCIYFVYFNIIGNISLKTAFVNLLRGNPIVSNGWYGTAILIFYLLFFISGKISKGPFSLIVCLFIGTLLCIFLEKKFNYGEWAYNALLCFPIGALWSFKEKEITTFLFNKYRMSCAISALLFSLFHYLDEIKPMLIFRSASVIFFAITIMLVSYKLMVDSTVLIIIKSCLFEIYLYHGLFIGLFYSRISSRLLYCLLVIGVSIIFSLGIKLILKKILSFSFEKKEKMQMLSKIE